MTTGILSRAIAPAALALVAFATAPASAAGSHSGGHGDAAIGSPASAAEADRTIEIVLRDNYYEPGSVQVQAGETVRFLVKNAGRLVHEFNIGTAAMHAAHQDEMMMMVEHGVLTADSFDEAAGNAMQASMGHGAHDDPNSVLLEPGKSGEVVWTFPASGTLEFACNVPGHYDAGMAGDIAITGN